MLEALPAGSCCPPRWLGRLRVRPGVSVSGLQRDPAEGAGGGNAPGGAPTAGQLQRLHPHRAPLMPAGSAAGGERAGLHLAVTAAAPLGRGEEALLRQHLRRPDPVLLRVPGQHAAAGHHAPHRQVGTRLGRAARHSVPPRCPPPAAPFLSPPAARPGKPGLLDWAELSSEASGPPAGSPRLGSVSWVTQPLCGPGAVAYPL